MPIIRRSDCFPLPIVVCPVVAVVMLESRVASCVHCVENVACQATTGQTTIGSGTQSVLLTMGIRMPETCWDNIKNKSPFVASSWSHTYLLTKDARSLQHIILKYLEKFLISPKNTTGNFSRNWKFWNNLPALPTAAFFYFLLCTRLRREGSSEYGILF